ncbi:MAG: hypothetical protein R2838_04605 [Caldilineaceae bacterium]
MIMYNPTGSRNFHVKRINWIVARAADTGPHPDEDEEQDDHLERQDKRPQPEHIACETEGQLVAAEEERRQRSCWW